MAVILLAGGIYFIPKLFRLFKKKMPLIPEDVMSDFDLAEKMMKESHGSKDPYEILWEIKKLRSQEQMKGGNDGRETSTKGTAATESTSKTDTRADNRIAEGIGSGEPAVEKFELPAEHGGGQSVQSGISSSSNVNQDEPGRVKQAGSESVGNRLSRIFKRK